jgi:multidrug efflux pump subunit AcrB
MSAKNKYDDALKAMYEAKSQEDVIRALQSNNVDIKNGAVMGGKKTKKIRKQKNKKQKGGFTYKKNLKRGSISTAISSLNTKSSPTKTSSMRSSTGRGRGRGQTKRR